MVGVVGTKTELSLLLVCGNEKLGKLPLVVVCGNAKGNLSRQGSIITSLQVTLDCSAVSQLARLDPSTVSAASVSAGKNMTHIVIAGFSDPPSCPLNIEKQTCLQELDGLISSREEWQQLLHLGDDL